MCWKGTKENFIIILKFLSKCKCVCGVCLFVCFFEITCLIFSSYFMFLSTIGGHVYQFQSSKFFACFDADEVLAV